MKDFENAITNAAADDEANKWRLETPGIDGWARTARPSDPNKYLMISVDGHMNEDRNFLDGRLDKKFQARIPRVITDEKGQRWAENEGGRRIKVRPNIMQGVDALRAAAPDDPTERLAAMAADGVDGEVTFPNRGLAMWYTTDVEFSLAQCRAYNDYAHEVYSPYFDRLNVMGALVPADIEATLKDIGDLANRGFRGLTLPVKPHYGPHLPDQPNYNWPEYDRMWAAIEETGLPISFHISTGADPRQASKNGGAVINYLAHGLAPAVEPVAVLCGAGILERFPGIKFGIIESGIGWLAWALDAMDEAYKKHHMFARPKMQGLPSDYFRAQGFVSFQEDRVGISTAKEYGLIDNIMWANDYPHHEGSWPFSAQAIERTMGDLTETEREKVLGKNAQKLFGFDTLH
ncbi:MAG: amidohydrolase [Gammaproteobacteria bacterium]|nr:MAG: amidohydrolase [Gammaproteobacteria bacterium]RLA46297.1 MAG: amidohydrolase [Gammaproteobacteria bacterium]